MSIVRNTLNRRALALADRPPSEYADQPQEIAALGGGGPSMRPIDWISPDEDTRLQADADDTDGARVLLTHTCGAEIRIKLSPSGAAVIAILGCGTVGNREGYALTPDGLVKISDDESGEIVEDSDPLGMITVEGCVDGETVTIRVLGEIVTT